MWSNEDYKQAGRSMFMGSTIWLGNLLAGAVTFVAHPFIFNWTIGWVEEFTRRFYGYAWIDFVFLVWWAMVAAIIFFVARASVATALVTGALFLIVRFF